MYKFLSLVIGIVAIISFALFFTEVFASHAPYECSGPVDEGTCGAGSLGTWRGTCESSDQTGKCISVGGTPTGERYYMKATCVPNTNCGHAALLPPPTVEIEASPSSIVLDNTATLSWAASDAASSCTASGAWDGPRSLSGSERVSPSTTSTYTLTCTGQGGSGSDSATITVTPPDQTQPSQTETTTQTVNAGGTISTDSENNGVAPSDPIETSVTAPVSGSITIVERPSTISTLSSASLLSREVTITAPATTPGNPFAISFQLHSSLLPPSANPNALRVFKDRVLVAGCPADPCVVSITTSGGNVLITVRTSSASAWHFGFGAAAAGSGGLVPCGGESQPACNFCHIFVLINNIIQFLLVPSALNPIPIIPVIASLLVAWGGFVWLTSAGSPQRVKQGQQILFAVVVGLLIVYGAWLFIELILSSLGAVNFTGTGNWFEIECTVNPVAGGPVCPNGTCDVGETNASCPADCPVAVNKRVFVTSSLIPGNFNGTSGDGVCQSHATAVGLGGSWEAWISNVAVSPVSPGRIADPARPTNPPYYLVDNATKVVDDRADLISGDIDNAINMDETGAPVVPPNHGVWTATQSNGTLAAAPLHCNNWNDATTSFQGWIGSAVDTNANWTLFAAPTCEKSNRLYCFER